MEDLEDSIELFQRAVALASAQGLDRSSAMCNVGAALLARYQRTVSILDLEEATETMTSAVDLIPDERSDKSFWLDRLSRSLSFRFHRGGDFADLEQAIGLGTRAVELIPEHDVKKLVFLNNLCGLLQMRYEFSGRLEDLEEVIAHTTLVAESTSDDNFAKPSYLNNLSYSLQSRFERTGNLEDLEKAITFADHAIKLAPEDHPQRLVWLSSLGAALQCRFERLGDSEDLEHAISLKTSAVDSTPDSHPDKATWLGNLSGSLLLRFRLLGKPEDLDKAIESGERATELLPDRHREKPSWLNNLANCLHIRFQRTKNISDLDRTIKLRTLADELTPQNHPSRPARVLNLASTLYLRSQITGGAEDLQRAITLGAESVRLTSEDHPNKTIALRNLGHALFARFRSPHRQADDLAGAMNSLVAALCGPSGHPYERIKAGLEYTHALSHLSESEHSETPSMSLLEAHQHVLDLVPRVVWLGNSVRRRYEEIIELELLGTIASGAAADAIDAGEHALALEWLESGRTVVWSQVVLRLRTTLDDLEQHYPDIAAKLTTISRALELAMIPEKVTLSASGDIVVPDEAGVPLYDPLPGSLESQVKGSHGLALEYENVISQIRNLPGFEDFLRPKKLAQLVAVCTSGPVVTINVHKSRCDALVLHSGGEVAHVPLIDFSEGIAKKLQTRLWSALKARRLLSRFRDEHKDDEPDRGGYTTGRTRNEIDPLHGILSDLWMLVAKPIIDVVRKLVRFLNMDLLAAAHDVSHILAI